MSDILKFSSFAVVSALAAFLLRSMHREAGAAVALAAGVMLLFAAVSYFAPAAEAIKNLSAKSGVENDTAGRLLKMIGVAYVSEFACQTCKDAGENGLAAKAALCGKMILLAQTLPLITQIGEITLQLLP